MDADWVIAVKCHETFVPPESKSINLVHPTVMTTLNLVVVNNFEVEIAKVQLF